MLDDISKLEKYSISNWSRRFLFAIMSLLYLTIFFSNYAEGSTLSWTIDILVTFIFAHEAYLLKEPWFMEGKGED